MSFHAVVSSFEKGVFSARFTASHVGWVSLFPRKIWWVRVGYMELGPVIFSKSNNSF